MEEIIQVKHVYFSYNDKTILNNISFTVKKGEYLGIIGANGSGKSTLIKLILNILRPTKGEILIKNTPISKYKDWNKIGYVSQKVNTFNASFPATVEEVIIANLYSQIGKFRLPNNKHKEKVKEALKKVDMQDYEKNMIGNLSGGQMQRVFIARALVSNPEILFLDEPTVGIDSKSEEMVYELLNRLKKDLNLTIVMITHDIGAVTVYADRIVCLGEEECVIHNTKDELNNEVMSNVYGYPVNLHLHSLENSHKREEK